MSRLGPEEQARYQEALQSGEVMPLCKKKILCLRLEIFNKRYTDKPHDNSDEQAMPDLARLWFS